MYFVVVYGDNTHLNFRLLYRATTIPTTVDHVDVKIRPPVLPHLAPCPLTTWRQQQDGQDASARTHHGHALMARAMHEAPIREPVQHHAL
jgi:hypothetical protein